MSDIQKITILLAAAGNTDADRLEQILAEEYHVITAASGAAALDSAKAEPPALILLHLTQPDQSGLAILKGLKETDSTRNIPVILLSGSVDAKEEEEGFRLGAADYLAGPINGFVLKARIGTHLHVVWQGQMIERLAMLDRLTGIPNQRLFEERYYIEWNGAVRKSGPISVLSIAIDRFEDYVEQNGYLQGDELIRQMSQAMSGCLKRSADFLARSGSSKFAVILPNTENRGAIKVADKIARSVKAVAGREAREGREAPGPEPAGIGVTVSIGVATRSPEREDNFQELLREAEEELSRAIASGGNRVCASGMF